MKLKTNQPKESFHVRLRPQSLSEVIGQDTICKALSRIENPRALLFTGLSGIGKTTLARIVGKTMRAEIIEVDGATRTGVDAMRELTEFVTAPRLSNNKVQVIVDECHSLSKATWQSLLKVVEEPPTHLYWAFCTTDPSKVPDTIKTRCQVFDLKPVRTDDLIQYLKEIRSSEALKIQDELISVAARKANGSVRQALVYLSVLNGVESKDEALALMQTAEERREVIDFIRYLSFQKPSWSQTQKLLQGLQEEGIEAESIRIVLANYLAVAVLNAKSENEAGRLLTILSEFQVPYNTSEKYAPLLLSVAQVIFPQS